MATLVFRMRKKKLQFHCQIGLVGSYITTHARSFFECWLRKSKHKRKKSMVLYRDDGNWNFFSGPDSNLTDKNLSTFKPQNGYLLWHCCPPQGLKWQKFAFTSHVKNALEDMIELRDGVKLHNTVSKEV